MEVISLYILRSARKATEKVGEKPLTSPGYASSAHLNRCGCILNLKGVLALWAS